jgi:hypothetical protein
MRSPEEYVIDLSADPTPAGVSAAAPAVFERVWRFDFTRPGFCLIDLGPALDSHALRALMLRLKDRLSELSLGRAGRRFVVRSAGRFDQQETTKFHLDGAPPHSLLLLGYEPSRVRSHLALADYTRCAFDLGITPQRFLEEHNPMFAPGERLLAPYATELPDEAARARLLLINNSTLPFAPGASNPLGVMHKAEVVNPTPSERRVVNSVMLEGAEAAAPDAVDAARLDEFVRTDALSQRLY